MYLIPCAISVLRAFSVVPLFMLFSAYPHAAFILFAVAALSDAIDGWLARILNAKSELGKILDPIADKILYLGLLVILKDAAPTLLLFTLALPWEALLTAIRFKKSHRTRRTANPAPKNGTMGLRLPEHFCDSFIFPISSREKHSHNPCGAVPFSGVGANPYGKLKTSVQFCTIACMMLGTATPFAFFTAFGFSLGLVAIPLAWMSFYTHIYPNEKPAST